MKYLTPEEPEMVKRLPFKNKKKKKKNRVTELFIINKLKKKCFKLIKIKKMRNSVFSSMT